MPRLLHSDAPQVLAVDDHLLIAAYFGVPPAAGAQQIQAAVDVTPELRHGYDLMIVVLGTSGAVPTMAPEQRRAYGQLMKNNITRVAYLVTLTGFPGVVVRSILSGMSLFGSRRPEKAFGEPDDAIAWLADGDLARTTVVRDAFVLASTAG